MLKSIYDYIFEVVLENPNLKIGVKKLSYEDIDRFNEESVDFSFQIIPKIYEHFKRNPHESDLLIGYYEEKFDWNDDSVILVSDDRLFVLEHYNKEQIQGAIIINDSIKI